MHTKLRPQWSFLCWPLPSRVRPTHLDGGASIKGDRRLRDARSGEDSVYTARADKFRFLNTADRDGVTLSVLSMLASGRRDAPCIRRAWSIYRSRLER